MPPPATLPFTQRETPAIVWPLLEASRFGGDFKEAVRTVVHAIGFEWFRWVASYDDGAGLGADQDLLNGGPGDWAELYTTRNYRTLDPLFREAMGSVIPRIWDERTHRENAAGSEIYEAAASYGMGHGVHMILHQPQSHSLNFFIVAASERCMDAARRKSVVGSLPDLWAIATYGRKLLSAGKNSPEATGYPLSARELECFDYVAQGMTSRTIGGLLGISERTVDAHIGHAIRKIGARNRREALARAIASGQLSV